MDLAAVELVSSILDSNYRILQISQSTGEKPAALEHVISEMVILKAVLEESIAMLGSLVSPAPGPAEVALKQCAALASILSIKVGELTDKFSSARTMRLAATVMWTRQKEEISERLSAFRDSVTLLRQITAEYVKQLPGRVVLGI